MTRLIKKRKDLNDEERLHIFMLLLKDFDGKRLLHGSIKRNAELGALSCRTVSRLWELGSKFIANGDIVDVAKKLAKNVGRKKIQIDIERIKQIPLRRRKTMAALAHALEVSKATVYRRVRDGLLRRQSNAIRPQLTDANKKERMRFCLSMLRLQINGQQETLSGLNLLDPPTHSENELIELGQMQGSSSQSPSALQNVVIDASLAHRSVLHPGVPDINARCEVKFLEMFDHVVIDEKWFYISKETERYYLTADEVEPHRTCKSKKFITKVMFLAVVARPRFNELGDVLFDGKIGIFPFTYQEPAKRRSKNRAAGTLQTKPILAVTQDVSRTWMIEKVLPAIREKWPTCSRSSTIFIQQDNARPHIKPLDDKFLQASSIDGFDIQLTYQPPNSPELNVLDLGYFRAIQSLQYQEAPKNIDELVAAVEKSFYELSPKSLNRVFLTLQSCMLEVLKSGGGNDFKIPHLSKEKLEREGLLPLSLTCNYELLQKARDHILSL